ncbi:CRISPR-associated helicase Cas3' [Enterococcus sp. DIV0876]|uniref:CRISPR-associated helicase Cas3' n=1 Tax=Enterococcus sp. DIV0876 TaxID=2774633 RepID=UPI003D30065A
MFVAHVKKGTDEKQALAIHLLETAKLSGEFGAKLGLKNLCYLAGLLHDAGKFSIEFQEYIFKAIAGDRSAVRGSVDHSTAGGKIIYETCIENKNDVFGLLLAELIANAIISHHRGKGLTNFLSPENEAKSDFLLRLQKEDIPSYADVKQLFFQEVMTEEVFRIKIARAKAELKSLFVKDGKNAVKPNELFFLQKFVYSCLLDADRTNTMLFETGTKRLNLNTQQLFSSYKEVLEEKIASFKNETTINQLRDAMSKLCNNFAQRKTGIYTLSIPTGGGKTLASLRFALNHAIKHGKKRIIYVVPFTTIIEQNAATVREILKEDKLILEHHSNIIKEQDGFQKDEESEEKERMQALFKDNWDAPLIFTTMVQFLNTIYSKGTRNPRRFHNLMDAVLIFDEAQGVPVKCTYLFNESLNFLKNFGNTTSVLCTATQPSLEHVGRKLQKAEESEMISDLVMVEEKFKRVEVIDKTKPEEWNEEEVARLIEELLKETNNLLVILNTKKAVFTLYHRIKEQNPERVMYHLSTSMCAAHRKDMLKKIKTGLKNGEPMVCITTQLIEAGVDISFETVIRSVVGLDSIAQAAGRCNRHGEKKLGTVYLVNPSIDFERVSKLPEISKGKEITMQLLRERKEGYFPELLSHETQTEYFKRYYQIFEQELGYPVMKKSLQLFDVIGRNPKALDNYFRTTGSKPPLISLSSPQTIAENFDVIDNQTTSVLVPYKEEGKDLINQLNGELQPGEYVGVLKEAQQYTVNLFDYQLTQIQQEEGVYTLLNGEILALREPAYSDEFGVDSFVSSKDSFLGF